MIKIQHTTTVQKLKELGYPLVDIRQAMPHLTGINHKDLAVILRKSRVYITLTISGQRKSPKLQQQIADVWGVPKEELFEDGTKENHTTGRAHRGSQAGDHRV